MKKRGEEEEGEDKEEQGSHNAAGAELREILLQARWWRGNNTLFWRYGGSWGIFSIPGLVVPV